MRVTPKTEMEIAEEGLLPKGEYNFEVIEAVDAMSKKQSEMIKLALTVSDDEGNRIFINDYLLDAIPYKVRHAAAACGRLDKYEAGELLAAYFMGAIGRCKIIIKTDKTGQYPPQNSVSDYVVPKSGGSPSTEAAADIDDDIPF